MTPGVLFVGAGLALLLGGRSSAPAPAAIVTSTPLTAINGSAASFARGLYQVVSRVWPSLSVQSRLLMVAHAAYESGWGSSGQNRLLTNNIWDLTVGSDWGGPWMTGTSLDGGVLQHWRQYRDLEEASIDYLGFLGLYDSSAAAELFSTADPEAFAAELGASGYYDVRYVPVTEYASNLSSIVATVATYVGVG